MPIYEYRCVNCGVEFHRLIMKREEEVRLSCPECGGSCLKRLISLVAYHVSEQERLEAFDPGVPKGDSFYRDSRNIGLHAKKRAQQLGVGLGRGFDEKLEKLRTDPGTVLRDSE